MFTRGKVTLLSFELLWVQSPQPRSRIYGTCEQTKRKECFLFVGGGRLRDEPIRISAFEAMFITAVCFVFLVKNQKT